MLRFFRINDPYRLVFIFLILIVIRFGQGLFIEDISYFGLKWMLLGQWLGNGFRMYSETFDYTGPIAAWVYKWMDIIFGRTPFVHQAFGTITIIIQAGIFNQLLLKNKAFGENSYLPAFLFMIVAVSIPDFMMFSPQLMSLTLILITLNNVLRRIDNQVTDELFLTAGIYIGVASLIYLPAIVYFLVFLFSFILFSSSITRRLLLYFFGFAMIFIVCYIYYYWFGIEDSFLSFFLLEGFFMDSVSVLNSVDFFLLVTPLAIVFLISLIKSWRSSRLNNFQQKVQQVLGLMALGGVVTLFLSNEKAGYELVFFVPIISYFATLYFMLIRKKIFKWIMPFLLLGGLVCFSCYFYSRLSMPLIVKSNKELPSATMVLGTDLSAYSRTEMASPCFNQHLTVKVFERMDHYDEAATMYGILNKLKPDHILDKLSIMDELSFRYPLIEAHFRKRDSTLYVRISN